MFDTVLEDVEAVFASNTWKANNILTVPDNYTGAKAEEYLIVKVLPSSSFNNAHGGVKELSGLVAIKLFVKAGEGQGRVMAIADYLDILLQNKTLINKTKLETSYLSVEGLDSSNKAFYTASYFIPFKLYGE
jgi:pyocin large subunit-like protein